MRSFIISTISVILLAVFVVNSAMAENNIYLENEHLKLCLDRTSATVKFIENKLAGQRYSVTGDQFFVNATKFDFNLDDLSLHKLERTDNKIKAMYKIEANNRVPNLKIEVTYTLEKGHNFGQKHISIESDRDYELRKVVVSLLEFNYKGLNIVPYRYQKNVTFFGRTGKGGFFTGLELPWDDSSNDGNKVSLAYIPSLKIKAGQKLECEPAYFGVYCRKPNETTVTGLPLQSESDAMVSMTSAIIGPRRHGLVPMVCGWHSEMEHFSYKTENDVQQAKKSLDFIAECGFNWLGDSHPWGGETAKMNKLVEGDKYQLGKYVLEFLEYAQKVGVNVVMWPTMNNTHPWWPGIGGCFRPDKPNWAMIPNWCTYRVDRNGQAITLQNIAGNCLANSEFLDWLTEIHMQGLDSDFYKGWVIDGSFFGHGGNTYLTIPVNCSSDKHDHLPWDSEYACERALNILVQRIRQKYPEMFISLYRPPMDLGIWSHRNADCGFTINEDAELIKTSGVESQAVNVTFGDKIRTWSRVRVHHHFYPHYLDQPVVFAMPPTAKYFPMPWQSEKIDYIMLSALSCCPNQLYYIPTRTGIPEQDKAQIRKWLDWGRKNIKYLNVRRDLPDWPAAGKVDGSAHIINDRGFVFLFNPNNCILSGEFMLNRENIGLQNPGKYIIKRLMLSLEFL